MEHYNFEKYEIHIGENFDLETNRHIPAKILILTKLQLDAILMFASIRKDELLNEVYKINDCEFKVFPYFHKV